MSLGKSRNHVCFACRHTGRASGVARLTCPFCRQPMVFLHKGFHSPPKKAEEAKWRALHLAYEQSLRSVLVRDLDDRAEDAEMIGRPITTKGR